jgi:methyl-accepting chemotaxis protein
LIRSETRKFMSVVFLAFFFVLLGVVVTTLTFSIKAIDENADNSVSLYKELVRESIENELRDYARLLRNPVIKELFAHGTGGDSQAFTVAVYNMLKITLGEPYYLAVVGEGKVILSKLQGETGKPLPEDLAMEGSRFTEAFREKTGQLVIVYAPLSEDLAAVVVADMTKEVNEAKQPFEEQKNRIKWIALILFIGFLILSLVVAVFIIGWANARYISGPIKDLEDKATRMMEGDTSLEIKIDEESDYYALQALLDSMQKLLREMERR